MKNKFIFIGAGALLVWWFLNKEKLYLKRWAVSTLDVLANERRLDAIKVMTEPDIKSLHEIVKNYFNKNISPPTDLTTVWLNLVNKYPGLGG